MKPFTTWGAYKVYHCCRVTKKPRHSSPAHTLAHRLAHRLAERQCAGHEGGGGGIRAPRQRPRRRRRQRSAKAKAGEQGSTARQQRPESARAAQRGSKGRRARGRPARRQQRTATDPVMSSSQSRAQRASRCEDTAAKDAGSLKSDIALTCAAPTAAPTAPSRRIGLYLGSCRGLGRGNEL